MNLKSKILNRRSLAIYLAPFVLVGLFLVYKNALATRSAYGVGDPLIVTYTPEGPTPQPTGGPAIFYVTNMLPGDEKEKDFNVKNDSNENESVTMDLIMTDEEKEFADILDVTVTELPSTVIFNGKLQALLDAPLINLGNFPAGSDRTYRVKVVFPTYAENEYQKAMVVFDIIWRTQGPSIEIPRECSFLEGKITKVVEGTEGNDFIFGTRASEMFILKGGRDVVFASKGDDIIIGGEGDDILLDGSDGNDCIIGGLGNDKLDGSDNNDVLFGNEGDDTIDGSDDDDLIYGGSGNDTIDGGGNNDKIEGNEGNDEIEGGSGSDNIHGNLGDDDIDGSSGNDAVYGDEGNDTLNGGSGTDLVDGGPDNDNVSGGSGNDTCINGETYSYCEI